MVLKETHLKMTAKHDGYIYLWPRPQLGWGLITFLSYLGMNMAQHRKRGTKKDTAASSECNQMVDCSYDSYVDGLDETQEK